MESPDLAGSLFIDGKWRQGMGERWTSLDPASTEPIAELAFAAERDVQSAVDAAGRVQAALQAERPAQRAALLHRIAAGLRAAAPQLARIETLDVGKPLRESRADVTDAARVFEFYAEQLEAGLLDEVRPALDDSAYAMRIRHVPLGVVVLVTAWNFPILLAAWKVAPALAAGNAVVLKPSEWACLSSLKLADIISAAGARPGQFNVVTGRGIDVGALLVRHPGVRKVSFTGSEGVGRQVLHAAAVDFRRVTLELGGKSPAIVFADADLDQAADGVLAGIFCNAGQVCSATSRLLVERSIHRRFVDRLTERALAMRLGPGLDENTDMGPLVSDLQRRRVLAAIEAARDAGIRMPTGPRPLLASQRGWFVPPTILDDVPADHPAWRNEIFGPVLSIRTFDHDAAAVSQANDSDHGLAAAVFSADASRAERVGAALQAGTVWINCVGTTLVQGPWGGFKSSGWGRELGRWGLESFCEPQQITRFVRP